ncbi:MULTISPECIES: prepilin peptidase [Rhodococcus]|uniref:Leader peptidase (Prepilin peptidase)/N-methyltransferase n=2 Tax=Nocardiaceae TaxID=85025 RepID=A0A652YM21_NOCGL|nr:MULTISPECIES: A24 family peptidase [Rhodococcus]NMD62125.1 prepilin peptidase [Nocardia globerula]MCE4263506.1 prepilin peptidase [Rhodococcus globerulus]MDV6265213.1 A24 family peptidase [Rhodococcus globerulus]PVX65785.1 leader peptidase (prepilin peptidase)/N-methyltransferase [Rhodococcus globerulus]QXW03049.1 A24 family peptidase [Rhodococcus globerulus]
MLNAMWMLVGLATAGAVGGFGARFLADDWLRRNLYAGISVRCGVPELCVAVGWLLVGVATSSALQLVSGLAFVWWCVAVSLVDVSVRRLPNTFTVPAYGVVIVGALFAGTLWAALMGSVMLSGIHLVLHLISAGSLGAGDVKLALPLGAITGLGGAQVWLLSAFLAPVITLVVAVLLARRSQVPHGPSMCGAALLAWTIG